MKNKTIQKMFATVLATILAVGCLTACGDEAANNVDDKTASASQSSEIQESEVSEEPEDPKEPVQINYVRYSGKSTVTPDLQMVEDAINEYIEPLINVTIDMKTRADLGGDIPLALAAGEDIDLFWANSGTSYDIMINGGAYDVTEKIKEYPDLYSLIPESVWEISTHLGRNYYIPIPNEFGTGYSVLVNKEYADKYFWNLSAVDELKDLEPMLADLKAEGVDYPFLNWSSYYDRWGSDEFDFITKYAGVERNGDTGKVVSIYETDAYKEYVDLKYSWNQAGYINQAEIEPLGD